MARRVFDLAAHSALVLRRASGFMFHHRQVDQADGGQVIVKFAAISPPTAAVTAKMPPASAHRWSWTTLVGVVSYGPVQAATTWLSGSFRGSSGRTGRYCPRRSAPAAAGGRAGRIKIRRRRPCDPLADAVLVWRADRVRGRGCAHFPG